MAGFSLNILRLRDFRLLLITHIFSLMTLQSQAMIVGWEVYSLTHDPFMLGLAGLVEAIPALCCALFAGHLVDIGRPFRVYCLCLGALVVNTSLLLVFAGGIVPLTQHATLVAIFIGVFISGVARSFIMPSSFSLLPQVVSRTQIPAAMALRSSGFQFASIAGPAVAGLIYGGYGVKVAWMLPASVMLIALAMLCGVSKTPRHYRSEQKREPTYKSIRAGWAFILHNPVLLSIMALDMFAVLFGGAVAMLPAYAAQVLHVGSQGLGLLRASPALGAIVAALVLAVRPMQVIRGTTLLIVVTGFGCSMIGFGLSTVFLVSMGWLMLSGMFDSVSMVIRSTLMQLLTPGNMRGRVSSVNSMFIISSNEIGAFESGLAARLFGLVPSVALGGVITLLVAGTMAVLSPKLRRLKLSAHEGE